MFSYYARQGQRPSRFSMSEPFAYWMKTPTKL
jgi:hypothetical protein